METDRIKTASTGIRKLVARGCLFQFIFVIGGVVLVYLAWIIFPISYRPATQWKTFSHPDFSIEYPATWQVIDSPDGYRGDEYEIAVLVHTNSSISVTIQRKDFGSVPEIAEVVQWGEERILDHFSRFQLQDSIKLPADAPQFLTRDYYNDGSLLTQTTLRDVYFVAGNWGYIITLRSFTRYFDDVAPDFQYMIENIIFLQNE